MGGEVDYRRGVIIKHFYAGEKSLRGDFESITFGDNRFFLMTSNGMIYEFPEGEPGERVDCTVYDTHLGAECEFEGMVYEPEKGDLLLSCGRVRGGNSRHVRHLEDPGEELLGPGPHRGIGDPADGHRRG